MIRTQISFEHDLYRSAQKTARRLKTSLAELCRRGLRSVLADEEGMGGYMSLLGTLSSGDPGASESVDAVVYGRDEP